MAPILRPLGGLAVFLALWAVSPRLLAVPASNDDPQDRIGRVEAGIPAVTQGERTLQLSLDQWMQALAVPGVSIAVIDDYRIAWTKSYGVTTPGPPGLSRYAGNALPGRLDRQAGHRAGGAASGRERPHGPG